MPPSALRRAVLSAAGVAITLLACTGVDRVAAGPRTDSTDSTDVVGPPALADYSVTPALVKNLMPGVAVHTILSSADSLPNTPKWVFGGSADGSALLRNDNGTFTLVVNNEDNFSISRVTLDHNLRPTAGEYLINSDIGRWRLCSGTLVTPAEHGFGPLFIVASEGGTDPMIQAVDPLGPRGRARVLPALGRWFTENAVPLPASAFPGKTVVVIGDDDPGSQGGQIGLYVADDVGDLEHGRLFVLARTDSARRERDMVVGGRYAVKFREIDTPAALNSAQLNAVAGRLGAMAFGRVEDLDYQKGRGNGRNIYFAATGQPVTDANADFSRTRKGRVYHLTLDAADPTSGTLEVVIDGDDPASLGGRQINNPDNILATEHYVYIQEDPNLYGDETHDSYMWQYAIGTGALTRVLEVDHRRSDSRFNGTTPSLIGQWENTGLVDVSAVVGLPSAFLFSVQADTWHDPRFRGPDGGLLRTTEDRGSQMLLVIGLPR